MLSASPALVVLPPDRRYAFRSIVRLSPLVAFAFVVGLSKGDVLVSAVLMIAMVAVIVLTLRVIQAVQWRRRVASAAESWHFPATLSGAVGMLEVSPATVAWMPRRRDGTSVAFEWETIEELQIQAVPTVVAECRVLIQSNRVHQPGDIIMAARWTNVRDALSRSLSARPS